MTSAPISAASSAANGCAIIVPLETIRTPCNGPNGLSMSGLPSIWGPPCALYLERARKRLCRSAVEGLARPLAIDLAPIRINAVRPGLIDTPLIDFFCRRAQGRLHAEVCCAYSRPVSRSLPRRRGWGVVPDEEWIVTGTILVIDGGASLTH